MNHRYFPAFIISAIALVEMATDMYLPNLPAVMKELHSTEALVHLTLSANLIGLAAIGIIAGPLSEMVGRRSVILSGLLIFLLGGLFCFFAPTIHTLIASRLLQGLGSGIVLVIGTSAMRDLYQGAALAKIMSMMGMIIAISPGIAPLIGGYIGLYLGWRTTFAFLVGIGLILLMVALFNLPETLAIRKAFSPKNVLLSYWQLLTIPAFLLNALLLGVTIAQLWIEMGNLPLLFIQTYNVLSHHYGLYFGTNIFIFILGTIFNQRYVNTYGVNNLLMSGILLKTLTVIMLCAAAWFTIQQAWLIQILMYPGAFGLALIISNASSQCLSPIKENVGAASALMYLLQMSLAALALYSTGLFFNNTLWPIAIAGLVWVVLVFAILSLLRRD